MLDNEPPSPTLDEYIADGDRNKFWRLRSGDHQNLLDDAIDELTRLRAIVAAHGADTGDTAGPTAVRPA